MVQASGRGSACAEQAEGPGALGGGEEGLGAELGAGWVALAGSSGEPCLTRPGGGAEGPGRIWVANVSRLGAVGGAAPVGGAAGLSWGGAWVRVGGPACLGGAWPRAGRARARWGRSHRPGLEEGPRSGCRALV